MATLAVVLVLPAVLFLVSTVAQFVVYYHASHLATAAAQEAARVAQLADGSEHSARAYGQDFLAQAGPNLVLEPQVLVTRDAVAEVVTVEVLGRAPQVMPGVAMRISASATGPLERFEADSERFRISEGSTSSNSGVEEP
ncbi:MAG TPA: TadE/TadG family type IV pilus assembly protein [Acidimicrobiales bacterium]|nr:TadE/TadG family type IV pilus assembly protein [Acidimicrobiales bacterium]